jgi:DNA-binding transcriptional regulator GbsR (MarR family)
MTDAESEFVEAMGRYLGSVGMTPMAGRMWAWLLICDPPEQTAADLAEALHASRGAISGTARLLAAAGMVRRTTKRGDRREYFSSPPGAFVTLVRTAESTYGRIRELTEQGLAASQDRPPGSRARLQEVHDFYAFIEREVPIVIERYFARRDAVGTEADHQEGAA